MQTSSPLSHRRDSACRLGSLLVLLSTTSIAAAPQVPKVITTWKTVDITRALACPGGIQSLPAGTDLMMGPTNISVTGTSASASASFSRLTTGPSYSQTLVITNRVTGQGLGFDLATVGAGAATNCALKPPNSTLITYQSSGAAVVAILKITAKGTAVAGPAIPVAPPHAKLVIRVDVGDDGSDELTLFAPWQSRTAEIPLLISSAGIKVRTRIISEGYLSQYNIQSSFSVNGSLELELRVLSGDVYEFDDARTVSNAGDVDGDDYDDIAITTASLVPHYVIVYSGQDGKTLWLARNGFDEPHVAAAGDVNADGFDDVVVGSPALGTQASPLAVVYSGKTGFPLHWIPNNTTGFGGAVGGAGDVNADGFDDFIVGAGSSDLAYVYSGRNGSILHQFVGDNSGDRFGAAVAGAGDVDGDSFADVVVCAPLDDNNGVDSGSARVFSGRTGLPLYTINGDSAGDQFGSAVDGGVDVDGDRRPDIVIGAPRDDNTGADSGSVRLVSGPSGAPLFTANGDTYFDLFGWSVAMVGNAGNNQQGEIIVGAPQNLSARWGPGYVRMLTAGGIVLNTQLGRSNGDQFGDSVGGRTDSNSNGWSEMLVGAPRDTSVARPGSVRVIGLIHDDDAGKFITYGAGCPGVDGRMPRIGIGRGPVVGLPLDITLASAPFSRAGLLRLSIGRTSLDLTFMGITGCTLLTDLSILAIGLSITTDSSGRSSVTFPVPNQSTMIGLALAFQWTILDPGVNPLGMIVSDGGEITIGQS